MNLLDLLDQVVLNDHLLPLLQLNDLLRLRRVCKSYKNLTEDFIRSKKVGTERQLKIKLEDAHTTTDPFEEFNSMHNNSGLPATTKLYFFDFGNPRDSCMFRKPLVQDLKEDCRARITHLTFEHIKLPLNFPSSEETIKLLKSFPSVKHLKLEHVRERVNIVEDEELLDQENIIIPLPLQNLITLRISNGTFGKFSTNNRNALAFISKLVDTCLLNLEQLEIPFHQFLNCDYDYIDLRMRQLIINLSSKCVLLSCPKLKLKHVDGEIIEELLRIEDRSPVMGSIEDMEKGINSKVTSLSNPQQKSYRLGLPSLEQIHFLLTDDCEWDTPSRSTSEDDDAAHWPNLTEIDVYFTTDMDDWELGMTELWDFLFVGIIREKVTKLDIGFWGPDEPIEIFPRTIDITTSLPNLKILRIRAYSKILVNPSDLWTGLPLLEELKFFYSINLRNDDFIGTDANNPAFFNLKRLRVLTLEGMEEMQVTDDLFSQVLCHMPLKKLFLLSRVPVESHMITLNGIKSLLTGIFATTIETFSLEHLELEDVGNEEKKRTKNLFRSSQMI